MSANRTLGTTSADQAIEENQEPAVLLLTHATDRDLPAVSQSLSSLQVSNLLWYLDAADHQLAIDVRPGRFELRRENAALWGRTVQRAIVVIYRPRLGWSTRIVAATEGTSQERQFAEREWSSLLNGLLLEAEERYEGLVWLNKPSVTHLAAAKYHLIATADLDGLLVPRLRISTESRLPESETGQYVCKAINEDEDIDEERTYPTTALEEEMVARSPFHTDCPSLIQERVDTQRELRLYYLLGHFLCLSIRADSAHTVDLRFVPNECLSIEKVNPPAELVEAVGGYCARRGLSYCVFDFLCTVDDRYFLVDVTPTGAWSHLESARDPFITSWYVDTLYRTCLRKSRDGDALKARVNSVR